MASRSDLIAPRSPRGFADRGAAELKAVREMAEAIRATYELWGFEGLETPVFEYTDALGKFLPDQDRPNAGVFSLQDDDQQWMSLRYDLTAPLARFVAENFQRLPKPYRSYRFGPVFRNEKPGPGRFRQFLQFDADIVGAPNVTADAEMCMMMADTLEAVGVKRGDYVIKVNNRKILDGVMEAIGLGGEENAGRRLTVLRALDKYDRLGSEGVRELLGEGRKDPSGDFTRGANLSLEQIEPLLRFVEFPSIYEAIQKGEYQAVDTNFPNPFTQPPSNWESEGYDQRVLEKGEALTGVNPNSRVYCDSMNIDALGEFALLFDMNPTLAAGLNELAEIEAALQSSGFSQSSFEGEEPHWRIRIDPSVVRGLEYYTGPVYEAELTFTVHDDEGRPIQFGSVGGGGRYDGLVGRFMAENVPATGFSIGVSRLLAALSALKGEEEAKADGPVVVLVMDRDRIGDSMAQAKRLRDAGITAEVYLGGSGMKAQMKYADRRRSPCVVIQGSDEREKGEVTLKDLVAGAAAAKAIADRSEWTESRPAQVTVAEDRLVDEVKAILARQG